MAGTTNCPHNNRGSAKRFNRQGSTKHFECSIFTLCERLNEPERAHEWVVISKSRRTTLSEQ